MKFQTRWYHIAAVSCLLTSTATAPAVADPWGAGPPDGGAPPDGSAHTYCWGVQVYGGVNADIFDNVDAAEYNALQGPTVVNVIFESCDYSGGTETDVVWLTENLPGSDRGSARCEDYDNGKCDQYYSSLDLAEIAEGPDDELDETKTACHELGHTVGLNHHPSSGDWGCMRSGPSGTALSWRRYVDHHVDHINAHFP